MAVAIAYPDAGHKHKSGTKIVPDNEISKQVLSNARKVLRLTPLQVPKVMSGELPYKPRPWLFYGQWVGAV